MSGEKYSLGLIGYPLGHSLSPKLHHAALAAVGLEGEYRLYPIAPGEGGEVKELRELLGRVRAGEIQGLNVTIPHKQTVIPYLDELTPTAQVIGAVNTIYRSNDFNRLIGDNTDAPGFLADLKRFLDGRREMEDKIAPSSISRPRSALVLGAGGSARAVVYALLQDGWHVMIAARRVEQAQSLAEEFFQPNNSQPPIPNIQSPISITQYPITNYQLPITLIINTTPLGMTPNPNTSPWAPSRPFPKNAALYDLVYTPRETKLVRDARAAGLPATTGIGMLIEQAALAFEIWTGRVADRVAMRDAVK